MELLDAQKNILVKNIKVCENFDGSSWIEISIQTFNSLTDDAKQKLRQIANGSFFSSFFIKSDFGVIKQCEIHGSNFDDRILKIYFDWKNF